ncbi:hypothetical protein J120_04635 [candidate division TM6 bacterium JCVI TM6SC1]|uniref:Uncharacterized protein n=1 Tax=candidate division TM6 bacterium JCVI TM6SC1 TaxID=1306947 RepID=A0A0D2K3X3_9BACT|nr:hypothetical protein J120_04635 [candidate division TM6 bacterium JCVI TM6SC1]
MNFFRIQLILLMCLIIQYSNAHDSREKTHQKPLIYKVLDAIAQFDIMHKLKRADDDGDIYKNQPLATAVYQQMGAQAYSNLDINSTRQLPIKQLPEIAQLEISRKNKSVLIALVRPNNLYINEQVLDRASYGSKRATIYHQCNTAKYADAPVRALATTNAGGIVAGMTYKTISSLINILADAVVKPSISKDNLDEYKIARSVCSHATGVAIGALAWRAMQTHSDKSYQSYQERRSNIESLYALQCSACVEQDCGMEVDINDLRYKTPCNLYASGSSYLSPIEKLHIAYDLKIQNKLCDHHAPKQSLQSTFTSKKSYKLTFWSLLKLIILGISPV